MKPLATTLEITRLLAKNAPVAVGVSGGKDSCAVAFAAEEHLNQIGHTGPRVLIHSDLGRVEWQDSLPTCERLASALRRDLITVRRGAGDMMDRWLTRWSNNVARYEALECVKLILPWSTPSMRFCTSELKSAVIARELVRQFPGETILSVSGIRRDESANRAKAPVCKTEPRLLHKTSGTSGSTWNPILDWSLQDVFDYLEEKSFPLHEAYTRYGTSRVSCCYCIMSSRDDLAAAATCTDNHDVYREMVELEAVSSFAFQESTWLGDVAPHLLNDDLRAALVDAKRKARVRERAEARIPKHLLYTKGWPLCVPSASEARLLCEVRQEVAALLDLNISYSESDALIARYEELMNENQQRAARKGIVLELPVIADRQLCLFA